ncbi:retrovirus-related pol polyprotein from transposon TNT 1-94 [Tanacetum coccineum]
MRKVLQERGFGSLPSSTETNSRDQVKPISTAIEADSYSMRRIRSSQYVVSTEQNSTLLYKSGQTTVPFPSSLDNHYSKEEEGNYGSKFAKAYGASHINDTISRKEKDPRSFILPCYINNVCFDNALVDLGASVSVVPLLTYLNLGLGELAHIRLTVELANKTVKYPKGIAENILVGIGKFTFPEDFIILNMPEDIKVPLILGRPFLSTARAKIDVYKKKITLRVGEERIVFTSVKPASSVIKRVYMLSLRERIELDLEAKLMGDTLLLNILLNPFLEDYIELNDLNEPFELRRNQGDDLIPIIEEGEVIEEFRTRDDELDIGIDDYPILEDMDDYRDEGMGDVIFGELFLREVRIKARRFDGMITIYNGNDEVTYQMVRSHPRFKRHTNEQCNKILPLLKCLALLLLLHQIYSSKQRSSSGFADEEGEFAWMDKQLLVCKKKFWSVQVSQHCHFARECTAKGTHDGKKKRDSLYQHQEAGKQEKNQMGFEIQSNDEVLSYEEEMNFSVFKCSKEDSIGKPSYSRFTKTNDFKGVPHPLSGDYTPKPQEEIDDSFEGSCENTSEHSFETESESLDEPNEMSKSRLEVTNEKDVSAPNSKEVAPSCVSHIKTPRQPLKDNETHKVNRKNWNDMMKRELGEGYSFTKKKCFVCGSLSHLIKDCDYYEKKMAREAEVKRVVNTGNGMTKPVWTNANRINHSNNFVPRSVQLNAGRPKFNSVRPNINTGRTNISSGRPKVNSDRPKVNTVSPKVNTVRPRQPAPHTTSNSMSPKRPQMDQINQRRDFSTSYSSVRRPFAKSTAQMAHTNAVMGSWGSAVKTSASYNWRNSRPNFNYNRTSTEEHGLDREFNWGLITTFGGSKGYISGKGRIRVEQPMSKEYDIDVMFDIDYLTDSYELYSSYLENQC